MATKLQHAIGACESYLRDHPRATVVDAMEALWESFALDRNDILPHKQIWFPNSLQEEIQSAIMQRVSVTTLRERRAEESEGA